MEELNTIENELKEKQSELDSILSPEHIYDKELAKLEKQYSAKVEKVKKEIATIEALKEKTTDKTTQDEKDLIEANNEEIEKKIKSKNNSLNRITANYEKKKEKLKTDKSREEANYQAEKVNKEKEIRVVKIRLLKAIENSRQEVEEKEQEAITKMEKAKQDFSEKVKKQKTLEQDLTLIKKIKQDFKGISIYTNASELKLQMDEKSKETMKKLKELAKTRTQVWEDKIKFEKEAQEAKENKETVMAKIDYLMKKYSLQEIELEEEPEEAVFEEEQEATFEKSEGEDLEYAEDGSIFEEEQEATFEEPEGEDLEYAEDGSIFEEEQEATFEESEGEDLEYAEDGSIFEEEQEATFEEPEGEDLEYAEDESIFEEQQEAEFEEPEKIDLGEEQKRNIFEYNPRAFLDAFLIKVSIALIDTGFAGSTLYEELLSKERNQARFFIQAINNPKIPLEQLKDTKREMENYCYNWDILEAAKKMLTIRQQTENKRDNDVLKAEVEMLEDYIKKRQTPKAEPKQTPEPEPKQTPEPEPTQAPEPEPTQAPKPELTQTPKAEPKPTQTPKAEPTPESEQLEEVKVIEITCFTKAGYYHFTFSDGTTIGINQSTRLNGRAESIIKGEVESKIAKTDNIVNKPDYILIEAISDAFLSKERKSPDAEKAKIRENTEKTIKEYLDSIRTGKQETGIPMILYDGIAEIEEIRKELKDTLNYNEELNRETDLYELTGLEKHKMSRIIKQAEQIEGFGTEIEKSPNKLLEMLKNLKSKATNIINKVKLLNSKETQSKEENNDYATLEDENGFSQRIEATDEQKKLAVKKGQEAAQRAEDQIPIAEYTEISEEAEKGR